MQLPWVWRRVLRPSFVLLEQSKSPSAFAAYLARTWMASKDPMCVRFGRRRLSIRPCTPDLSVAVRCFTGEFAAPIAAAKPLRHKLIIDAGGYIGTAAIAFAEAFPEARIVTLEPSLDNFTILERNVRPYPNIVPLNKALGVTECVVPLRNRGTGEWGFSTVQQPADCPTAAILHTVPVTTIPALIQVFGASGIDLLKLDIEGAEFEILNTPHAWLAATRVLFAELHDRIVPGCGDAFARTSVGRSVVVSGREKVMSLA
jgi:FkbM family methyltransferase